MKNIKFYQDNAKTHIEQIGILCLENQNFIIMNHPSYSPDLAFYDFWLFDYIKQHLDDHSSKVR